MADETFDIEFTSKSDSLVNGTKRVVAELDKVTEATKKATQAGDGLVKQYSKLSAPNQIAALSERKKALEERFIAVQQSRDPRRRDKLGALRSAMDTIDARVGILSAGTGVAPSGSIQSTWRYGMGGGFRAGAMEGGLAGGLVGGMIGGAVMALISGLRNIVREITSLPSQARERTASAKAEEAAIRKTLEWSEGAQENLAMLSNIWTALVESLKKGFVEATGTLLNGLLGAVGAVEYAVGWIISKSFIPGGKRMGASIMSRGEGLVTQSIMAGPKWLGGLGGTGQSGVVESEAMLGEAQKRETERKQKEAIAAREREKERYAQDYKTRKERWEAQQFKSMIETAMGSDVRGARQQSSGLYAVGGEAAIRAYYDEANNLQRQALAELKTIAKNTQMPLTERDLEQANVRLW